jgi:hypothetical protein
VRIGTGIENGRLQPAVSWTRNDTLGPLIYNYSLSAFRQNRASDSTTTTVGEDLGSGAVTLDQRDVGTVREHRPGPARDRAVAVARQRGRPQPDLDSR